MHVNVSFISGSTMLVSIFTDRPLQIKEKQAARTDQLGFAIQKSFPMIEN